MSVNEEIYVPRRQVEPDQVRELAARLAAVEKLVISLGKSASLRNASISGGDGLTVKDENNNIRLRLSPEGAIIAYDGAGAEVARYGLLAYSDAGQYGIEALSGDQWVHVGDESVTWANIAGRPDVFAPQAHQHPGADITSAVALANNATNATHAGDADGSAYAFANTVSGTQFYAVWVGNDGGYHLGRNVSSIRYKMNVRDFTDADPLGGVLRLRTVVYDRKPREVPPASSYGQATEGPAAMGAGARDEYGMIAEEVYRVWPEVVTWFDAGDGRGPQIDGIRYDLVAARLIPVIQKLVAELRQIAAEQAALREKLSAQDKIIEALTQRLDALEGKS